MKADIKKIYEQVFALYNDGDYRRAIEIISKSDQSIQESGAILILNGDCFYESGNDLEALKSYLAYLKKYPKGRARNFARFNSAICLKNIGLYEQAEKYLLLVEKGHENLEKELEDTRQKINEIQIALNLLAACY